MKARGAGLSLEPDRMQIDGLDGGAPSLAACVPRIVTLG